MNGGATLKGAVDLGEDVAEVTPALGTDELFIGVLGGAVNVGVDGFVAVATLP